MPRSAAVVATGLAEAVANGLLRPGKSLPPWLFYDEAGSALFERITALPEYYPTRTERAILTEHGDDIVRAAGAGGATVHVAELGAGTASKTEILLAALVRAQPVARFLAVDIAEAPLRQARVRMAGSLPSLHVRTLVADHDAALPVLRTLGERVLVAYLGSSIGNYDDDEAARLLGGIARAVPSGGRLLLGTDLRKDVDTLVRAYDDAEGVTAAFNRNVLVRLNRELGADFDVSAFRHVALWNETASRVEMHLEARMSHVVDLPALGARIHFDAGERIHTESSVKYDLPHVDRLLAASGWLRTDTWTDPDGAFALHLATV